MKCVLKAIGFVFYVAALGLSLIPIAAAFFEWLPVARWIIVPAWIVGLVCVGIYMYQECCLVQ